MFKRLAILLLVCGALSVHAGDSTGGGGTSGGTNATKLQGYEISPFAPADSQALLWNNSIRQWQASTLASSADIIASDSLPVEFVISGAGNTAVNGSYALDDTRNGSNAYHIIPRPFIYRSGEILRNNAGNWTLTDSNSSDVQYSTVQTNLTSPVGATWVAGVGALPVPTITVGSSDAAKFYLYAGKWLYRPRVNGERGFPLIGVVDGIDIKDTQSVASIKPDLRTLIRTDAGDDTVLDWAHTQLLGYPSGTVGSGSAVATVDWTARQLLSDGSNVALDWSNAAEVQIGGSTIGTAAFTDSTDYDTAGAAAAITLSDLGGVPTTRTVNSKALSGDITLSASDVGADASGAAAGVVSDTAYNATTWDAVTTIAPSKNAVRDKIVSMDGALSDFAANPTNHADFDQAGWRQELAVVDDTAYNATTWDAVTAVAPSKNAVRDKIETLQPLDSDLTSWAGVTRASGFDTFTATPTLANLFGLITDEGTGVATALGVNVGSAGAFVTNGGALGTPSSGTVTNLTGTASININGTVGATTPAAGTFTTGVFGSTTSLLLGTAGSAVGNIGFRNATSGTATLAPPTGGLSTYTVTLPNAASTLPIFGQQITFSGPTAARTVTFPDASFTAARTDAANTFTGTQTFGTIKASTIVAPSDSTTAILITKADGTTAVGTWDTTNGYLTLSGRLIAGTVTMRSGVVECSSSLSVIAGTSQALALGANNNNSIWRILSGGELQPGTDNSFDLGDATHQVGSIYAGGKLITTPQALSGAGAVNVTTSATAFTSTGGAQALTLADGTNGQIKTIAHVSDGGSGVLTPTTKSGYSTITFTNVGDAVTLQFFTTAGWIITGQNGVTVTP